MSMVNYHIQFLKDVEEKLNAFLEAHKECKSGWEEASPILYSIKCFESTTSRWVVAKCEKCGEDGVFILEE